MLALHVQRAARGRQHHQARAPPRAARRRPRRPRAAAPGCPAPAGSGGRAGAPVTTSAGPSPSTSRSSAMVFHITVGIADGGQRDEVTRRAGRRDPAPRRPPGPAASCRPRRGRSASPAASPAGEMSAQQAAPGRRRGPTSGVAGTGRLVAAPRLFSGGKSLRQARGGQLVDAFRRRRCPSAGASPGPGRDSPAASRGPRQLPASRSDSTTWPPCAVAAIRAARCTSIPM